ncbi:ankyrin [Paraphaeosphaeria sporulosa]|uniref:Ankyrin n=1 Tax=Paraphaeosphaeria sporulosa TaxID=1460663 RepID=A0A177CGM1_9PLEO|nr:ankyrin [Paraphaeosphaeria sporulosa]OAG06714.1 ankyrin [Paraphaeosphaeria sporulosa]
MVSLSTLPDVPAKHADFVSYVESHPDTSLLELLEPYKKYDAKLREIFAQEPDHPVLADEHLNVVPVFNGHTSSLKIRARDLDSESQEEKERYIMSLGAEERRPNNSPAIVQDIKEFQQNFALFCESSLVDLDWSNVVAAGSSVVTCLLPVPKQYKESKRALRQYYHETIAPASDVDLFIYGLSEEEAVKKIIEVEKRIKDSILTETTTIRTKNAITIASQYPTRHIQIVLRIYKSVSEILTGFDVDCSCAAYDGKQVWAAPRALTAYMTQANTIDLTRRSPSYESRLSKYSHRGFEVYWPLLERSRVDPTIFERNFGRTVGLARLLVLERLPTKTERESYMDERRRERGRPPVNRYRNFSMRDNIKDRHEDEVAEWVEQEDVSDYHTFTIPYGQPYHAKKIEKLLYTKDLLLNSEWNKPKDREVNLHRHPAFFGFAEDIINDCCGFCPQPVTPEEHDVAEEERKIYVSGKISFIKDDPGRQAIGSFNPITDDDWTEMAYVGNTARLCQAIVDEDLEHVVDWLEQDGSDPNCRDYTGRTPLHLAVTSSTPEIVRALIDHGARLVARLADGRTALHLAAARGSVEMVRMIMQKSEENEEEEAKKEDVRKKARMAERTPKNEYLSERPKSAKEDDDSDVDMIEKDEAESDDEARTTMTGSYIKVKEGENTTDNAVPEEDEDDPDVYDVNVLAWDLQCSPLHLAILKGHTEVVKELVQSFGADVFLPIKLLNDHDKSPRGAILTLVLSLGLPLEQAKEMTKTLLSLGATSVQADTKQMTALHYVAVKEPELLEILIQEDEPAAKRAINHLGVLGSSWRPSSQSPLMSAISSGNALAALKLLESGANPSIDFKDWMKSVEPQFDSIARSDSDNNRRTFTRDIEQPIILAIENEVPEIAVRLLEMGADPDTLTKPTKESLERDYNTSYTDMDSVLDIVRKKITDLRDYVREVKDSGRPSNPRINLKNDIDYLEGFEHGTYKYFVAKAQLERAEEEDNRARESYEDQLKSYTERKGVEEKIEAIKSMEKRFEELEQALMSKGAKTFKELHPNVKLEKRPYYGYNHQPWVPPPFEIKFDFSVPDLTDERRDAYSKLFQAVWDNDLETVKSLTLAPWGHNSPLKISVQDGQRNSIFAIAVIRGHLDLARALVEICYAQFQPPEDDDVKKSRYRLANEDEDDESDMSDIAVLEETVDDRFTIENIGELSTQVKSDISPIQFMAGQVQAWNYVKHFLPEKQITYGIDNRKVDIASKRDSTCSLRSWALITNDRPLFSFLLDLDFEWTDRLAMKLDGSSGIPSFSGCDFHLAVEYGRTELLADMIKHAGAGIELESFVKNSGVKYREKPKFYQGLSVHGKKRPAWINAARGTYSQGVSDSVPPLLSAAFKGSLQMVEWFMGDAPARHYLDFAEAYKHDKYIGHINKNAGGFERLLRKWLGTRRELALHLAVMAEPSHETFKLIKYLIDTMPDSLEVKSTDGYTPLLIAFSLHRFSAAKLLIEAGADQTARISTGSNILDVLLVDPYRSFIINDNTILNRMLSLIDPRLVPSLLSERTSAQPGSLTPVAHLMTLAGGYNVGELKTEILETLLDFATPTNYAFLELLDGAGDTPLHWAVKKQNQMYMSAILSRRPDLLFRENSVGRTPCEMAEDSWLASRVRDAPSVTQHTSQSIVHRSTESFAKDHVESAKTDIAESIWAQCREVVASSRGSLKRKLVSLLDANEVANRLAKRHMEKRATQQAWSKKQDAVEEEEEEVSREVDEVRDWFGITVKGDGKELEVVDRTVGGEKHALMDYARQLRALER